MRLESAIEAQERLRRASIVFWDFDGVIKDSVTVKSDAFEQLFMPYGGELARRVRQHHEANGGVSRYEKIPTYLAWAGEPASSERVAEVCAAFSRLVWDAVINSPWVPGVREYLQRYYTHQRFVLVTATPQEEAQQILLAVELAQYFQAVHGAPTTKSAAIRAVLGSARCDREEALMVGDSESDLSAAEANRVAFLLRCTPLNLPLQDRYSGPAFEGLEP